MAQWKRASSSADGGTTWIFSSFDEDFRLLLGLALGSPISHSSSEGNLGVALESLQGQRDLIKACVRGHSLLQGIFLTQGSNSCLVHCRLFHLPAEPPEKPHCLKGVVYKDLNPGIAGKGWPTHPVSQSSPTRGSQLQKMGLVVPARCKEQVWA